MLRRGVIGVAGCVMVACAFDPVPTGEGFTIEMTFTPADSQLGTRAQAGSDNARWQGESHSRVVLSQARNQDSSVVVALVFEVPADIADSDVLLPRTVTPSFAQLEITDGQPPGRRWEFTEGSVDITDVHGETLRISGTFEMRLRGANGQDVDVRGSFVAPPRQ
jgi:hypothetical protein